MVFQLAYAEAGQMIEAELADFLEGIDIPSMAGLSAKQLELINNLQKQTLKEEEELSHRMAMLQQGMADQPLLSLAEQVVTVLQPSNEGEDTTSIFEDAVDEKLKLLEDLLIDADNLRKESLMKMLKILTTIQSAQYLAAAGQLQVALRKVGEIRERKSTEVELTSSFSAEDIKDSHAAMAF
ncbi:hypothetical protein O6H91_Y305800 [Diphasiastrum complanatum]|nr:hypothetical protein O6H91_Y305800 [Diphasiastrum complanatum]